MKTAILSLVVTGLFAHVALASDVKVTVHKVSLNIETVGAGNGPHTSVSFESVPINTSPIELVLTKQNKDANSNAEGDVYAGTFKKTLEVEGKSIEVTVTARYQQDGGKVISPFHVGVQIEPKGARFPMLMAYVNSNSLESLQDVVGVSSREATVVLNEETKKTAKVSVRLEVAKYQR